jgi:5'-nucleotidase
METTKPLLLLTNDDGFFSEGMKVLADRLEAEGQTFVVAPDQEKSATSLALNLHRPLRLWAIKSNVFAVDGTPADCVYLAVQKILPRKPDLLISGINPGPNLGQQDISYSGTVAGALQGAFLQIPSIAISVLHDEQGKFYFEDALEICLPLIRKVLQTRMFDGTALNINIPPPPVKGIKIVKLGQKRYNPEITERKDPRNRPYYWIGTGRPKAIGDQDSDVMVIKRGFATVTPLHRDMTNYALIQKPEFKDFFQSILYENL